MVNNDKDEVNLDHLRGFTGLLRSLAYKVVFFVGLLCAIWVTLVFLFGPQSWNEGNIPRTYLGALGLFLAIVIPLVISIGCYVLKEHLKKRWPYVNF